MKIVYPNYKHSILNLANSIMKHFEIEYHHDTLPMFDQELSKQYKNVVVFVLDGMGSTYLRSNDHVYPFFNKHIKDEITSVFPPTTVAAITTLESGLAPLEHTWLGWCLRFEELQENVNVFLNTNEKGEQVRDYHVARTYIPYMSIVDKINAKGHAKAYAISPYNAYRVDTFQELLESIEQLCAQEGRHYLYAYWPQPDMTMHYEGVDSECTQRKLEMMEAAIQKLCEKLEDTLVVVTADHGHIACDNHVLYNQPEIMDMLICPPTIEARALSFFVKEEMKGAFVDVFHKYYGNDFLLFSKEEVIQNHIFGEGNPHPRFSSFLGDYLAVAKSNKAIYMYEKEAKIIKSTHAGLSEEEMMVPFIMIPCR